MVFYNYCWIDGERVLDMGTEGEKDVSNDF